MKRPGQGCGCGLDRSCAVAQLYSTLDSLFVSPPAFACCRRTRRCRPSRRSCRRRWPSLRRRHVRPWASRSALSRCRYVNGHVACLDVCMKRGGQCTFVLLKQCLAAAIQPSEQPPPATKPSLPPCSLVPALQAELRQALAAALTAEEQLELAESRTAVVEKAYAAAVEVRWQPNCCPVPCTYRHDVVHAPAPAA